MSPVIHPISMHTLPLLVRVLCMLLHIYAEMCIILHMCIVCAEVIV